MPGRGTRKPPVVKLPLLRDVFEQQSQARTIREHERLIAELARRGN